MLVLFILNVEAKTMLAILTFLHCEEFMNARMLACSKRLILVRKIKKKSKSGCYPFQRLALTNYIVSLEVRVQWTFLFLLREIKFSPRRNKYTRGKTSRSVKIDLVEKLRSS